MHQCSLTDNIPISYLHTSSLKVVFFFWPFVFLTCRTRCVRQCGNCCHSRHTARSCAIACPSSTQASGWVICGRVGRSTDCCERLWISSVTIIHKLQASYRNYKLNTSTHTHTHTHTQRERERERVSKCRFFDSKIWPLLLVFDNPDPSAIMHDVRIIFKNGDGDFVISSHFVIVNIPHVYMLGSQTCWDQDVFE